MFDRVYRWCLTELMIECEPRDLRYNATEFDGWNERHWTVPFEGNKLVMQWNPLEHVYLVCVIFLTYDYLSHHTGERFSLVWFTPLGVNIPEDLFWIDQATGKVKA
jgi:hypothetical protein